MQQTDKETDWWRMREEWAGRMEDGREQRSGTRGRRRGKKGGKEGRKEGERERKHKHIIC